jgi:pimeloyl-ACP methyl ester carboxylesterase
MADDLKLLLDELNIKNKVNLLGHSYGARTAIKFYSLYPERVA